MSKRLGSNSHHYSQSGPVQPTNLRQDVFQKQPLAQSNVFQ